MTQKQAILGHLERGKEITPLQALKQYGCFRLASVIFKLKQEGYNINTYLKSDYSEQGNVKIFAEYRLIVS